MKTIFIFCCFAFTCVFASFSSIVDKDEKVGQNYGWDPSMRNGNALSEAGQVKSSCTWSRKYVVKQPQYTQTSSACAIPFFLSIFKGDLDSRPTFYPTYTPSFIMGTKREWASLVLLYASSCWSRKIWNLNVVFAAGQRQMSKITEEMHHVGLVSTFFWCWWWCSCLI